MIFTLKFKSKSIARVRITSKVSKTTLKLKSTSVSPSTKEIQADCRYGFRVNFEWDVDVSLVDFDMQTEAEIGGRKQHSCGAVVCVAVGSAVVFVPWVESLLPPSSCDEAAAAATVRRLTSKLATRTRAISSSDFQLKTQDDCRHVTRRRRRIYTILNRTYTVSESLKTDIQTGEVQ